MNKFKLEFEAISENEGFARVCAAAFASKLDPTLEEINDIKTAVSEAVTNSIIHGYNNKGGIIEMCAYIDKNVFEIEIRDYGRGIDNIEKAREPLFTTDAEHERSGMGFTFMEVFMDELQVISEKNKGTTVVMRKKFNARD